MSSMSIKSTKKGTIASLLKSRRWITASALDAAVGGSPESGVRAARRLREDGIDLKVRRGENGTEYRKV